MIESAPKIVDCITNDEGPAKMLRRRTMSDCNDAMAGLVVAGLHVERMGATLYPQPNLDVGLRVMFFSSI